MGFCESGADLSRELNPTKYQYLARYLPQAVHFPGYVLCLVALLFLPETRGKHLTG
jgi:hypothetical protein